MTPTLIRLLLEVEMSKDYVSPKLELVAVAAENILRLSFDANGSVYGDRISIEDLMGK